MKIRTEQLGQVEFMILGGVGVESIIMKLTFDSRYMELSDADRTDVIRQVEKLMLDPAYRPVPHDVDVSEDAE